MRRRAAVLAMMIGWSAAAAADERGLTGFVMQHGGELRGRVTDLGGDPMRGVQVHIATRRGEQVVKTDKDGRYRAEIAEGAIVYVREAARIEGQTAVAAKAGEGEAVEIHDAVPAKTIAQALSDDRVIPPYSEEAKDRNEWRKAWLLLDIDATGAVARLQLLHAPGLGLDEIAVREGFALRFRPARDRADRPIASLLVWSFEWPQYWWLSRHENGQLMPDDAQALPCRGSRPSTRVYRDCPEPDLAKAATQPWIPRPRP